MNNLIEVDADRIIPNENNPRKISDLKKNQLKKSLEEFPEMLNKRPLVCITNKGGDTYTALGGNMRLQALKDLGFTNVPITLADDWSKEQQNKFIIKDNVSFGFWDWDTLESEWVPEEIEDWGLDLPADWGDEDEETEEKDPFNDKGIEDKQQYGVIVICNDEEEQEKYFKQLDDQGFNCKVVVT